MKKRRERYEVVVVGGGMAGYCAAVAAARRGVPTCLVQDRPVLGGNASSEIRVTVHGAACHHAGLRETGILGEAMNAERRANHLYPIENGWTNSVHDLALYDIAEREGALTVHLNTTLRDVRLTDGRWGLEALGDWPVATDERGYLWRPGCHAGGAGRIEAIKCSVANAETEIEIVGRTFIDATGDGVLAHLAGCEWRMGSESRAETGEVHAPEAASRDTMGNSLHFRCIDTGRPAPYKAPEWAKRYEDASFFYEQGRRPNEPEGGYWWIEIGVPWDTIHDNETIRKELTRHALGVWDWMKNRDPKMKERTRNYALEFLGQVPGKRESRRVMGHHFLNENELQARTVFADECAYGGWFIDLHTPGGLLAASSEPDSVVGYDSARKDVALKLIGPYGLPMGSLIARDVDNLMMAGRNISVTHAALGTVRVMATCGLMGEAAGTFAAMAAQAGEVLAAYRQKGMTAVQQQLLRDNCYLPNHRNADAGDLARGATATASTARRFSGLGVRAQVEDRNLRSHVWQVAEGKYTTLDKSPCQWIMLGERLDSLSLALANAGDSAEEVRVVLRPVRDIWAYEAGGAEPVYSGKATLAAGYKDMLELQTGLSGLRPGCYRIEVSGAAAARWLCSTGRAHAVHGGHIVGSGRYHWNRLQGEFAFQMAPAQAIFEAEQVLSGVNRPTGQTHLWLSDAAASLPQWLRLDWPTAVTINEVILTFPMQLVLETHWENPFYLPPHLPTAYRLQALDAGQWRTVCSIEDNAECHRVHRLAEPVRTAALRVVVDAVHGSASAGIVAIRCYGLG